MSRSRAVEGIFVGALLILLAYASAWLPGGAPTWGVWAMIVGSAFSMSAATMLGAANSHVTPARVALVGIFLFIVILAGFGAPLLLGPEAAGSPLILGLPLRAAIEIYGVGLLPMLVLPVLYAVEFKHAGLDEAALAAFRRKCADVRARDS